MSNNNIEKGRGGESLASQFLKNKGYSIIERNYRCRWGEVDIIALKDETLHFVEVKTRTNDTFESPLSAVTSKKLLHIKRTALHYIQTANMNKFDISIDGIGIYGTQLEFIEGITY